METTVWKQMKKRLVLIRNQESWGKTNYREIMICFETRYRFL